MWIFLIIFVCLSIWNYGTIYRYTFLPWREPDFIHRHWAYWFDEKWAFSSLAMKRRKILTDKKSVCRCAMSSISKHLQCGQEYDLDLDVMIAYQQHLHKKFEEIVLDEEI
jgi:hypothetical protein